MSIPLHSRLVGTQFPPWTEGDDVWGVQHLLHPDLKETAFMEWYGSEALLAAVSQLLHTKRDDLQFGKENRMKEWIGLLNVILPAVYRTLQPFDQPPRTRF